MVYNFIETLYSEFCIHLITLEQAIYRIKSRLYDVLRKNLFLQLYAAFDFFLLQNCDNLKGYIINSSLVVLRLIVNS